MTAQGGFRPTEADPDDYRDLPVFGEDYCQQVWRSYAAKAERVPR